MHREFCGDRDTKSHTWLLVIGRSSCIHHVQAHYNICFSEFQRSLRLLRDPIGWFESEIRGMIGPLKTKMLGNRFSFCRGADRPVLCLVANSGPIRSTKYPYSCVTNYTWRLVKLAIDPCLKCTLPIKPGQVFSCYSYSRWGTAKLPAFQCSC